MRGDIIDNYVEVSVIVPASEDGKIILGSQDWKGVC